MDTMHQVVLALLEGKRTSAKQMFSRLVEFKIAELLAEKTMTAKHPYVANFEFDEFGLSDTSSHAMGSFVASAHAYNIDDEVVTFKVVGQYSADEDDNDGYTVKVKLGAITPVDHKQSRVNDQLQELKTKILTALTVQVKLEYIRQRGKQKQPKRKTSTISERVSSTTVTIAITNGGDIPTRPGESKRASGKVTTKIFGQPVSVTFDCSYTETHDGEASVTDIEFSDIDGNISEDNIDLAYDELEIQRKLITQEIECTLDDFFREEMSNLDPHEIKQRRKLYKPDI